MMAGVLDLLTFTIFETGALGARVLSTTTLRRGFRVGSAVTQLHYLC